MVFEEPKNYYVEQSVGKWTVIGKEDSERENFGSGGGKVIWRKGEDVAKEAGSLSQQQQNAATKPTTDPAADSGSGGW